ncbi:MAG: hypothetical protein ABGX07_02530, partial [Pirellulaceae bacterium]
AGTQVVDVAIEAAAAWQRSGNNANSHGSFAAAAACDDLVETVPEDLVAMALDGLADDLAATVKDAPVRVVVEAT